MKTLALILVVAGTVLFAAGDLAWLVRNTLNRPLPFRSVGAVIVAGIVLVALGLVASAFS